MTHQEKAREIVERFQSIKSLKDFGGMDSDIAKECAVICVEEKIDCLYDTLAETKTESEFTGDVIFAYTEIQNWKTVKSIIEKL